MSSASPTAIKKRLTRFCPAREVRGASLGKGPCARQHRLSAAFGRAVGSRGKEGRAACTAQRGLSEGSELAMVYIWAMDSTILSAVAQLSNTELLARVTHLAELDARRLYLAEGCSSLFTYCTRVLHLAEHAAYGRIEAARAARRFPLLLERLAEGSVTLTAVGLLAAHLTPENHRDLLDLARHKSKQVEELVARLRPQPPVHSSVRKLPTVSHATVSATVLPSAASNPWQTGDAHDVASPPPCRLRYPRYLPHVRASSPRWRRSVSRVAPGVTPRGSHRSGRADCPHPALQGRASRQR